MMKLKLRRLTSSEARARFGELLESLESDGPVEITKYGRTIAVLNSKALRRPTGRRLAQLAKLYSRGEISWPELRAETDLDFGSLLAELGRQKLPLPQSIGDKSAAQMDLFHQALERGHDTNKTS